MEAFAGFHMSLTGFHDVTSLNYTDTVRRVYSVCTSRREPRLNSQEIFTEAYVPVTL